MDVRGGAPCSPLHPSLHNSQPPHQPATCAGLQWGRTRPTKLPQTAPTRMILQWCFLKTALFPVCGGGEKAFKERAAVVCPNIASFYNVSVKQRLPMLLKCRDSLQMSCLIYKHGYRISSVVNNGVQITFAYIKCKQIFNCTRGH